MMRKQQPAVEMRHLRLMAAIAEHGRMTLAGGALNLTQPALSHQLRELETRLRTPLFVRTTRRTGACAWSRCSTMSSCWSHPAIIVSRSGDVTPTYQIDLIELLRRQLGSGPANVVDVSRASLRRKRESAT